MKKYVLASLVAATVLTSGSAIAQDKKTREKESRESKESDKKEKMDDFDQIIIRKKGDKDTKVTIEIKDGDVLVNGKSIDDYDDDNLSVRRIKTPRLYNADARFRSLSPLQGQTWNFSEDGEAPVLSYASGNKAFLGVATEGEDGGAKITSVTENSAAEKAGLKKGDVITKINENSVEDPADLTKAIAKFKPEDKVTVTYKRDGKENKANATLGKNKTTIAQGYSFNSPRYSPRVDVRPRIEMAPFEYNFDSDAYGFGLLGRPRLGIKAQDTEDGKGVKVLDVANESLAEKSGIKEGDIITEFDGKSINSADQLAEAAQDSKEKPSVKVQVTRDGKSQSIEIKVPKKLKTANL